MIKPVDTLSKENSFSEEFPSSEKVYVEGKLYPEIRVPMRKITLSPTKIQRGGLNGTSEINQPVYVYDTSGPYTDPHAKLDIRKGLEPVRSSWIHKRGDVEELATTTSEYG